MRKRTELDELLETNGVKSLFFYELELALEDEREQLLLDGDNEEFEFRSGSWNREMAYHALCLLRCCAEDIKEIMEEPDEGDYKYERP